MAYQRAPANWADGQSETAAQYNTFQATVNAHSDKLESLPDDVVNVLNVLLSKGDLLTRNNAGQLIRITRGAEGTVLTSRGATASGYAWETPPDPSADAIGNLQLDANGDYVVVDTGGINGGTP